MIFSQEFDFFSQKIQLLKNQKFCRKLKIFIKKYFFQKNLGFGGFGHVTREIWNGKEVAFKTLKSPFDAKSEFEIVSKFNKNKIENIVQFLDYFEREKNGQIFATIVAEIYDGTIYDFQNDQVTLDTVFCQTIQGSRISRFFFKILRFFEISTKIENLVEKSKLVEILFQNRKFKARSNFRSKIEILDAKFETFLQN